MRRISYFLFLILLSAPSAFCETTKYQLANSFVFFKQDSVKSTALPISLSKKTPLLITIELNSADQRTIQRVYSQIFQLGELKSKIEIFYFQTTIEKYFSQQIEMTHAGIIVGKCTSYFANTQSFLVPGACSGRDGDFFWGLSLFKN